MDWLLLLLPRRVLTFLLSHNCFANVISASSDCLLDRLQELDMFDDFFKPLMEKRGYSCLYKQRPNRKNDGCGIFYRPDRWESFRPLLESLCIVSARSPVRTGRGD